MDIKLNDFEGPLDLLLHLVSKYEVDIYDVPLVEVIEQYLAYLKTLQSMRLEIAGDYMVMASQLMLIKSRKLLPKLVEEKPVEESPEYELLNQLEEYSRFKLLSQEMGQQHDQRARHFSKPKQELVYDDSILVQDKTVVDLYLAFAKIMARKQEEFKYNHATIEAEDYHIEDAMLDIEQAMSEQKQLPLSQLFGQKQTLNDLITLFLALLELIKLGKVTCYQAKAFDDIYLEKETV
ncbi:segregation/condensation protein A [Streptococcus cuniculipharyngis]|uniref:Segregation and condensation protein A n=1 Tax=Streptococcus cuniculipharyngis TaxID=1562651 RepID=A0A5C5SBJ6_9STRE|nr:segregation/condensation protein A [Streptococcus cuniculipharyngis]TWS98136.1 segregation/condensation protein A [Streptococcus cuniculipharyngis]